MFTVLIFQYSSSIFTRALETAVKASSTVTNRFFFPLSCVVLSKG